MLESLFRICLQFVSENITLVQSLVGFPELIGEQIVQRTTKVGAFSNQDMSAVTKICSLFVDAYSDNLLPAACLANNLLVINMFTEPLIQLLRCVRELDLSGCHLGDKHEVMQAISCCQRLTTLLLRENCLSDEGVRFLTLPTRLFSRGPMGLRILDLSGNPNITDKSAPWFLSFKTLDRLLLSGTSITERGIQHLRENNFHETDDDVGRQITTQGWAANVLLDWTGMCLEKQRQAALKRQRPSASSQRFYKKKEPVVLCNVVERKNSLAFNKICLRRELEFCDCPAPSKKKLRVELF